MIENLEKKNKVVGVLSRVIYKNETNNYHILSVDISNELKENTVTVIHPNLFQGVTYEFTGEWTTNGKYGNQFNANMAIEVQPSTIVELKAYLRSSFFPGIGPVIAQRIVDHFGENIIEILNKDANQLLKVSGISKSKLVAIKSAWEDNKEINEVMLFLQKYEISTLYASKIYEFYGKDCVSQILNNPYKLASDISGIGFKFADKVAIQVGFELDSPERIRACINYVLEQSSGEGHCFLFHNQICSRAASFIQSENSNKIQEILDSMEKRKEIKTWKLKGSETRYYAKTLFYNETYCAEKVHALKEKSFKVKIDDSLLDSGKTSLSEEQKDAVRKIVGEGISVLTGGPGVGKTMSTKKIVEVLQFLGKKITLAAPTGRASKRMTEVIGMEATTIHRLLSWDPFNGGFLKNESNTINSDFIIIDESSMLDINLAAALLRATDYSTQILFIGDIDQLLPVGPGNFFKDVIKSSTVPAYRLTKIFRQGSESFIVKHAHEINGGLIPSIKNPLISPSLWKDGHDCLFIESGFADNGSDRMSYSKNSSLHYGLDVVQMITKLYMDIIPKYKGKETEIQILIPMNVGDLGCIKINSTIQEKVNPKAIDKGQIKIKDRFFRVGDKVIQTKNNYDLGVFNGDIGRISHIDEKEMKMIVKFSDEQESTYKKSEIFELDLAYAISIHKSQGSEFNCVIIPIMMQYYRMLERCLIYTALTRAKKCAIFVGQIKALEVAIRNVDSSERQTSLKEMLLDESFVNPLI